MQCGWMFLSTIRISGMIKKSLIMSHIKNGILKWVWKSSRDLRVCICSCKVSSGNYVILAKICSQIKINRNPALEALSMENFLWEYVHSHKRLSNLRYYHYYKFGLFLLLIQLWDWFFVEDDLHLESSNLRKTSADVVRYYIARHQLTAIFVWLSLTSSFRSELFLGVCCNATRYCHPSSDWSIWSSRKLNSERFKECVEKYAPCLLLDLGNLDMLGTCRGQTCIRFYGSHRGQIVATFIGNHSIHSYDQPTYQWLEWTYMSII